MAGEMKGCACLLSFIEALERAWDADTSASPDAWTPENMPLGQCAVTALVVQDIFGGELMRAEIDGISHYWNRLPGGAHLDLTAGQFPLDAECTSQPEIREREYVLSFPATVTRYELLAERLGK